MTVKQLLLILTIATCLFVGSVSAYIYFVIAGNLPSLAQLENPPQSLATQIMSQDGEVLDHFFIERRVNLNINQIPKGFTDALVATEDRKFYDHWGVDIDRILKAMIKNVFAGRAKEGASTITQQLARNLFLDQSMNLTRKLREAAVAVQIEDNYTKSEILEMYANTVAFGRGAYGIQIAARTYFNKKPNELSVPECAYLVGLLKAPSRYDARVNYDRALNRRNLVLRLMKDSKFITEEEYFEYSEEPININQGKNNQTLSDLAPHFVESIRQQMSADEKLKDYDLYRDGLTIHTTINAKIQKYANEVVEEHLKQYQEIFSKSWNWGANQTLLNSIINDAIRKYPDYLSASAANKDKIAKDLRKNKKFIDSVKNVATTIQVSLTVIDPSTGAILAMVGGSPKFMRENPAAKYSLNHANQIRRQPGSSVKPFVYAMALSKGMNPEDMISCGPFSWTNPESGEVWRPSSGIEDCPEGSQISLADALRRSVNSVAARLITQVTNPSEVRDLMMKAGVESKILAVPALALGAGGEMKPIELTSAFGTFANEGYHVKPYYINSIEDRNGNIIYDKGNQKQVTDVLNKEVCHKLTSMLQGVVNRGTAARIRQYFPGIDAAGKTGTTNDNADAWFTGYTPQLVCGVWVGFDDHRINFDAIGRNGQGGRAAAPMWGMLMNKVYKDPMLPYKQRTFNYLVRDSLGNLPGEEVIEIP